MQNIMAWLISIKTEDLAKVIEPSDCNVCPCKMACWQNENTGCAEVFHDWAMSEYGESSGQA